MENKSKDEKFISIVLVQVGTILDFHTFETYIRAMYLFLDQNYTNYEIVVIDQGNINLPVKQKQGILLSVPNV